MANIITDYKLESAFASIFSFFLLFIAAINNNFLRLTHIKKSKENQNEGFHRTYG
jgi:hypothetical protein